jgi:hypothetical protein
MAATTYGPLAAPNGIGMGAWYTAQEWNGYRPTAAGDWFKCGAPASTAPEARRRSEVKIGASQAAVQTACGMTTKWSGWIKPLLGAAATLARNWHCVLQLHGPDYDGAWRGAQPFICIRDGKWRLEHGMAKWEPVDLMPFVNGEEVFVEVEATMSEIPEKGRIAVTLTPKTGAAVFVEVFRPTWEHQWSVWHAGLYRGAGSSGTQPTYEQLVYLKDCRVDTTWPPLAS